MSRVCVSCFNSKSEVIQSSPKKGLIICLGDLTTDEQDEQLSNTADWTKFIDHGGLMHVNDNTYMLFHSMELEVCKHIQYGVETHP